MLTALRHFIQHWPKQIFSTWSFLRVPVLANTTTFGDTAAVWHYKTRSAVEDALQPENKALTTWTGSAST